MQRYSRQRAEILGYLQSVKTHPTAETVFAAVRQTIPDISLGTVYRNLTQLAENGTIQRLRVSEGPDRFDATAAPHYHFYCRRCGRVSDFSLQPAIDLNAAAAEGFAGIVESHEVLFSGICAECTAGQGGAPQGS